MIPNPAMGYVGSADRRMLVAREDNAPVSQFIIKHLLSRKTKCTLGRPQGSRECSVPNRQVYNGRKGWQLCVHPMGHNTHNVSCCKLF